MAKFCTCFKSLGRAISKEISIFLQKPNHLLKLQQGMYFMIAFFNTNNNLGHYWYCLGRKYYHSLS